MAHCPLPTREGPPPSGLRGELGLALALFTPHTWFWFSHMLSYLAPQDQITRHYVLSGTRYTELHCLMSAPETTALLLLVGQFFGHLGFGTPR
jgi:hypothetical protein